jgi:hypothetical protein
MKTPIMVKVAALQKIAFVSGLLGAIRADQLSPQEVKELREYYGLKPKGGLKTRSYWKTNAHAAAGGLLGTAAGYGLGRVPAALGGTAGMIAGAIHASNKYSPQGYAKIKRNKNSR